MKICLGTWQLANTVVIHLMGRTATERDQMTLTLSTDSH